MKINWRKLGIGVILFWAVISVLISIEHSLYPTVRDQKGEPVSRVKSPESKQDIIDAQEDVKRELAVDSDKQILFGDLHVHTTFSMDAYAWSLPLLHGNGVHPPADACDYARFCSKLDFWSTNDHAESLTSYHWDLIKDSVRQCNALSGPKDNPAMVTFLGWEWTQMGNTPDTHYGHRVVVLKDQDEGQVPDRPVMSGGVATKAMKNPGMPGYQRLAAPYLSQPFDGEGRAQLRSLYNKQDHLRKQELCPKNTPIDQLPDGCMDYADTPGELQDRLKEWGHAALVIPHGTTWGYYTPPNVKWDKQLNPKDHDPELQRLIEVFSGHGNSEEYRSWRAATEDSQGNPSCPAATPDYLPCCERAAQIIQSRCENPDSEECTQRMDDARINYINAGRGGRLTIADAEPEDWLNCGQCTDCYMPAFNYRPGNSVQYIMQLANNDTPGEAGGPERFRFGFIGSSDTHSARPGNGYKENQRHTVTDASGAANPIVQQTFFNSAEPDSDPRFSVQFDLENTPYNFLQINETERQAAFFMTGGLVAVHSPGRDRDSIFNSLYSKETYATSGSRQLLWFNLVNEDGSKTPMGQDVRINTTPKFEVQAAGAFVQKPGCPADSIAALGEQRLQQICGAECYHPGDARIPIEQIEVVRIRPRKNDSEDPSALIEDPWKVLP
ncbi:MAG: DUF3604 domain-containing protein, partial [Limnobacter sp.]|nr:DUF3604 domain-containing protein [Limnobacter sp.]